MTSTQEEHGSAAENEQNESVLDQDEIEVEQDEASEEDVFNAAEQRINELTDSLLRARAETENLRRRAERDVANAHRYGLERFANQLLPIRDSLELGLAAASQENATVDHAKEGMELTLKMLTDAMEKVSIIELNPLGEKFNPEHHQAMQMQETDEAEPNTVLVVHQKGYTLSDRLMRPAMVVVAKATST
ncbi:MAG: nucleotide exchange factor GrpE [Gammaproteobacteria bacterium]|nr:nucleotide exchange factor GrpE [Gammaproteobacteria bacterium]